MIRFYWGLRYLIPLFLISATTICSGLCQTGSPTWIGSKEKAMLTLHDSDLFKTLRNPADTLGNVDRFLKRINYIVPISKSTEARIKALLLEGIQQNNEHVDRSYTLLSENSGQIPVMGLNVDEILKEHFKTEDCEMISIQQSNHNQAAISAYSYLVKLYKEEKSTENLVVVGCSDTKMFIDMIFDYYDI